jgi:hypothetical protein
MGGIFIEKHKKIAKDDPEVKSRILANSEVPLIATFLNMSRRCVIAQNSSKYKEFF